MRRQGFCSDSLLQQAGDGGTGDVIAAAQGLSSAALQLTDMDTGTSLSTSRATMKAKIASFIFLNRGGEINKFDEHLMGTVVFIDV